MSEIKVSHLIPDEANTIIFARIGSLDSGRRLEISSIPIPTAFARVKFLHSEKSKPRPIQPSQPVLNIALDVAPKTTEPSAVNILTDPRANSQHRRNEQSRESHHCASITNVIHNSYPSNSSVTREADTTPASLPRATPHNRGQTQGRTKAQTEQIPQGHAAINTMNNNNGHSTGLGRSPQHTSNPSPQDPIPLQTKQKRKRADKVSRQPDSQPINRTSDPKKKQQKKNNSQSIEDCRRCHAQGPFRMEFRRCCRLVGCTSCGPYTFQFRNSIPCVHRLQEIDENKKKAAALWQHGGDLESDDTLVSEEVEEEDEDDDEVVPLQSVAPAGSARRSNAKRSRSNNATVA
ncbi:hypothetical protein MMC30_003718 [Trapelia coarctata]|nr:hypothetical protein [Trapelia coarctata]